MNKTIKLVAVNQQGQPAEPIADLPDTAVNVLKETAALYARNGNRSPWVGYLAVEGGACVGTCAFKTPPRKNRVEIAYFTFPEYEGRGIATRMAALLVEIAFRETPGITVVAQTLPEENASTTVLRKNGFRLVGELEHPEDGTVWEWHLTDFKDGNHSEN